MVPLNHYLVFSSLLFSMGVIGVLTRRNGLVVLMAIELMLNAANVAFIAFSRFQGGLEGQVFAFFVIALAAAEAALGLAILIAIFRLRGTIDLGRFHFLRG